ncbi:MAG: apolipoprotein N-acyltransferase [Pseudomonadota bacterium]
MAPRDAERTDGADAAAGGQSRGAARINGWRRYGLAFLAGLLLSAGHAPIGAPVTAFVALPLLAWLLTGVGAGRGAATAWCFGFGYFLVSLHWIGHAFLVEADAFAWALPFAVTLLPAGLALLWALAGAGVGRLSRGGVAVTAVGLTGALTLVEYARAHILTGFPWAMPGYLWAETPLAQLSAWIGPFGLTVASLLLAMLPGAIALDAWQRSGVRGSAIRMTAVAGIAASLIAFAGLWMAGRARVDSAEVPVTGNTDTTTLRIIQPNAPQHLKWQRDWAPRFYRRLLELSASPPDPALGPADLVIWPETAVAFLPADFPEARRDMADAAAAPLVLGALDRALPEEGGEGFVNALMVIGAEGEIAARYAKAHLVPFGEYLPLRGIFQTIGLRQLAGRGRFAAGPGPMTVSAPGVPDFAALICYEAIFPGDVAAAIAAGQAKTGTRPQMMLQITNDAWFGTLGGPQQHLSQARMRAIEQGMPLVRSANTGISAVIDAHGRVVGSIPLGQHGVLDIPLPAAIEPPFYARYGDGMAIFTSAVLFFASFLRITARRGGGDAAR